MISYKWVRLAPNPGGEIYEKVMVEDKMCDKCLTAVANGKKACEDHQ